MNIFNQKNRILLRELVKTDFKLRYQGSLVGHLWSILKPLMLFGVMYMVFINFMRFGDGVPHFAVALLLGVIMWNFFMETTGMGLRSVVDRGDLLRKLSFPSEILVISVSMGALINFGINLLVVFVFAFVSGVSVSWLAIFAPFIMIQMYVLALGVSFLLANWYVRFRDISPIWEVVGQIGFYATPIIYPLSMISDRSERIASFIMLNPYAQMIQDMRHMFIDPSYPTAAQMLPIWAVWIPYAMPFIIFLVGYHVFKKNAKKYAEII
jgi:ABC-2 type transport system permease protein